MNSWWIASLAALAVFLFAGPLLRLLVAAMFSRQIGEVALAQQPDTIHLAAASDDKWKDPENARQVIGAIRALGFEDAGTFKVSELPGFVLALLAHPGSSTYAAVYEHPKAGSWFEFFRRASDGTGATFSNLPAHGLSDRPGHPVVRAPGSDPAGLFERAKNFRLAGDAVPASAADAVRVFETAYAESMAWRKQHGVTRAEVMRVAQKRAA